MKHIGNTKNGIEMKHLFSIVLLAVLLLGCTPEGRVYEKHKDLSPQVEWKKQDVREFKVPIEDAATNYNMAIAFRYAYGYQFDILKIAVTEVAPDGTENNKEYELTIRDENGDYIGEGALDIWDSEHPVEQNKKYPSAGEYTYRISHVMPQDPLNFAMEIGVIIDKVQ